jgi:hypothetical protein
MGINGSYHFYNQATSSDGGRTWSKEIPMQDMGCAKPELMLLDSTPGGVGSTGSPQPVLLGGGRKRLMNTSDVLLWSSADGMGQVWEEFSVSYWHNLLAAAALPRSVHILQTENCT